MSVARVYSARLPEKLKIGDLPRLPVWQRRLFNMKLIKGDSVKIVRGKDSGKIGKVERVLSKEAKVLVEGINQYKRHMKARVPGQKSEIITITKPLSLAN